MQIEARTLHLELDAATPARLTLPRLTIVTVPLPPQILPRALATPSLVAHIVSDGACRSIGRSVRPAAWDS